MPGKTKPSPNNETRPYFTQHFDFAFVSRARNSLAAMGIEGLESRDGKSARVRVFVYRARVKQVIMQLFGCRGLCVCVYAF